MKNYNVKVQMVKEDVISIPAYSKKEAIKKVEELIFSTTLKDFDVEFITNKYISIDIAHPKIFKGNEKIISVSEID